MNDDLMYAPKHFRVEDRKRLSAFIERNSFGVLLSNDGRARCQSSWLPFLVSSEGTHLEGHLARANSQWRGWTKSASVSVLFLGPHAYVSPTACGEEAGPQIPTWNYAAVRVDGVIEIVEDPTEGQAIISRLVVQNERDRDPQWTFDADSEFSQALLKAIVCFRISIKSMYGSFKMSQNKSESVQDRVVEYLRQSGALSDQACGIFMRESQEEKKTD